MVADYSIMCQRAGCDEPAAADAWTDEYGQIHRLSWGIIVVWTFGVPFFYLGLLLSVRHELLAEQSTPLVRALEFLHEEYEPVRRSPP